MKQEEFHQSLLRKPLEQYIFAPEVLATITTKDPLPGGNADEYTRGSINRASEKMMSEYVRNRFIQGNMYRFNILTIEEQENLLLKRRLEQEMAE